jgi:hypothetical protein
VLGDYLIAALQAAFLQINDMETTGLDVTQQFGALSSRNSAGARGLPADFPRPSLLRQCHQSAIFVRSELYCDEVCAGAGPAKRRKIVIDDEIELQSIACSTSKPSGAVMCEPRHTSTGRRVQFTSEPPAEFTTFSSSEYDRHPDSNSKSRLLNLFSSFL